MKSFEILSFIINSNVLLQNPENLSSSSSKKSKETKSNKPSVKEFFARQDVTSKRPFSMGNDSISSNHNWRGTEAKMQEYRSNSIVSGSQKLKDLQELHKELNRSSYERSRPLSMVI